MSKRFIVSLLTIVNLTGLVLGGEALFANTLADRLLVEVNTTIYTQRQMESYLFIKNIIAQSAADFKPLASKNWQQSLTEYVDEMIVDQEAQKGQSFNPPFDAVQSQLQKIQELSQNNPKIKSELNRLGLETQSKTLKRSVTALLRVDAFRRQKIKRSQNTLVPATTETLSILKQPSPTPIAETGKSWMDELREQTIVRYFKDARVFKSIHPEPRL